MEEKRSQFGFLISGSFAGAVCGLLIGVVVGLYSSVVNRNLMIAISMVACSTAGAVAGAIEERSKRRWTRKLEALTIAGRKFRFSLRAMLVMVTIMCLYLAWATYWIRQRHELLEIMQHENKVLIVSDDALPPWPLFFLGEHGVSRLEIQHPISSDELEEALQLFPEAEIVFPVI
jgi:hypothetical protein